MLLIGFRKKYVYSSKYEDFPMITKASKKMNVFLFITVIMHSSLAFGMDGNGPGIWESAKAMITTSYLYNRALSPLMANKIVPVITFLGTGAVGGIIACKSDKFDNSPVLLGLLGTLALSAGGFSPYMVQDYTEEGLHAKCKKEKKKIKDHPYITAFPSDRNPENLKKLIFTGTKCGAGEFVVDRAAEDFRALLQSVDEFEIRTEKLAKVNAIAPVKEKGATEYKSTDFSDDLLGMRIKLEHLQTTINTLSTDSDIAAAKIAHIQQERNTMFKQLRNGVLLCGAFIGGYFAAQKYAK